MRHFLLLNALFFIFPAYAAPLTKWLKKNEPIVIEYVQSLEPGKNSLDGIRLSNGKVYLNGFRYQSQIEKNRQGTDIHLFEKGGRFLAIIWLSETAQPLTLPNCKEGSEESNYPWSKGSLISGDVYGFKEVKPNHGIVISYCPSDSWLKH